MPSQDPLEQQAWQLNKLMKNVSKPVELPEAPKEKELRPAREMMKNVQGSSAGAGSGEFHVYKHARRREYERMALMEREVEREQDKAFAQNKQDAVDSAAQAKLAKNQKKRQRRKQNIRGKGGKNSSKQEGSDDDEDETAAPLPKKRLIGSGREIVFGGANIDQEDSEQAREESPDVTPIESAAAPAPVQNFLSIVDDE